MNSIFLNGIQIHVPLSPDSHFHEIMSYLKGQIDPASALISCVRIDGNDVPNTDDSGLTSTPVSHLGSIEVFTSHPKEVADETLYDLVEFSKVLESFALSSAEQVSESDFPIHFNRLIEGISTFTEAISGVKRILRLGLFNSIQVLEADLFSILRDILKSQEAGQTKNLAQLLKEELPKNLKNWRERGLPSLIRSRDS